MIFNIFKLFNIFIFHRIQAETSDGTIDRLLSAKRTSSRRYAHFESMFKALFPNHSGKILNINHIWIEVKLSIHIALHYYRFIIFFKDL